MGGCYTRMLRALPNINQRPRCVEDRDGRRPRWKARPRTTQWCLLNGVLVQAQPDQLFLVGVKGRNLRGSNRRQPDLPFPGFVWG